MININGVQYMHGIWCIIEILCQHTLELDRVRMMDLRLAQSMGMNLDLKSKVIWMEFGLAR